ncbi:MAG: hypothetical protein J7501_12815 [Bdellovibrio sp.]|nr:hypothetical protein [Bdellovibrio sp.]
MQATKKIVLSAITAAFMLTSVSARAGNKGTAILGAVLGGVVIGGLIGASIAQDFDDDDNRESQGIWNQALNRDYRDTPYSWQGREHRGRLLFTSEGWQNGLYCRAYRSEVWNRRADTPMVTRGVVCQDRNGQWFRRENSSVEERHDDYRDSRDRGDREDRRRDDRREEGRDDRRRSEGPGMSRGGFGGSGFGSGGVLPAPGVR